MNWTAIWQYVVGALIVTWPPVLAGFWVNWRLTRNHVDARTLEQTEQIAQLTADQTAELLRSRHPQPAQPYHGHGENSGTGS